MSTWTHVAGVIRAYGVQDMATGHDWDSIIGKECLWGSNSEAWKDADDHPEEYMPLGSEGTLQKSIWVNPDKSDMTAYTISVFGDLRDWYDVDAIVEWFKKIVKNKLWVRSAVITVTNTIDNTRTWAYNFGEEEET